MSQILVSCETPMYLEQYCLRITCSIWYFTQFVRIAIFMSIHVPAGACILVANESPIHVFPIRVLKHCGAHKHSLYIYIYIHARNPIGCPSWRALPASWGVKKA